jgi:putative hydrolase of the HAD superfamily
MTRVRAVLFDFGGTLFDYSTLAAGERDSIVALARWAGATGEPAVILRTYRTALKRVFYQYLPRPYYLHRDLFRDVLLAMAEDLNVTLTEEQLARYRARQYQRRERDFVLREGVHDTLAALRAHGCHLGIVSNADDDQFAHMVKLGQLESHFDSLLSSEQARSCKPDLAIFQEALRRADCAPEEALFVGDSLQQDIAGANRLGLQSVLIWSDANREPPAGEHRPRHIVRHVPALLKLVS